MGSEAALIEEINRCARLRQDNLWPALLIYADWLEERGDARSEGYRWAAQYKRRPVLEAPAFISDPCWCAWVLYLGKLALGEWKWRIFEYSIPRDFFPPEMPDVASHRLFYDAYFAGELFKSDRKNGIIKSTMLSCGIVTNIRMTPTIA